MHFENSQITNINFRLHKSRTLQQFIHGHSCYSTVKVCYATCYINSWHSWTFTVAFYHVTHRSSIAKDHIYQAKTIARKVLSWLF